MPSLADLDGGPRKFRAVVQTDAGSELPLEIEACNAFPMTINDNNDNINGIDWDDDDPMIFLECLVKLTDADGRVGYGHVERSARRSTMPVPEGVNSLLTRA